MARYTKQDQFTIGGQNTENEKIETAINDTLSRKGDSPNAMEADLDMNSNRIINLADAANNNDAVPYSQALALLRDPAKIKDASFVNSLKDLTSVDTSKVTDVFVRGFYAGSDVGGGLFYWDSTQDKANHNGGTVIDPDRLDAWNGTQLDLNTLFTAAASGSGCFVRILNDANSAEVNAYWFGVVEGIGAGDGNLAAYNKINSVLSATGPAGSGGGVCAFEQGLFEIPTAITMPNRVSWKGQGRSTLFRAKSGFTQEQMFYFVNGTASMFNSRLEDCWIQVNDEAAIKRAILADAWQENCGLKRVVINGFQDRGVVVRIGYGGAAYLRFDDVEIFGSNVVKATYGIEVQQVSLVGGFVFHLNGATIAGGTATGLGSAVRMVNDSLISDGFHVEYADNGILLDGVGKSSVRCATGSSNAVDNLITLSSTFTGELSVDMAIPNGATTTIRDNVSGRNLTGVVSSLRTGFGLSPQEPKAWVCFDGTTGTIKDSFNVSGVTVNGTGDFTVLWDLDFLDLNYAVSVHHNATTSRLALSRELGKTLGQYRIGTSEWTGADSIPAVAINPTNVYVVAYSN